MGNNQERNDHSQEKAQGQHIFGSGKIEHNFYKRQITIRNFGNGKTGRRRKRFLQKKVVAEKFNKKSYF